MIVSRVLFVGGVHRHVMSTSVSALQVLAKVTPYVIFHVIELTSSIKLQVIYICNAECEK